MTRYYYVSSETTLKVYKTKRKLAFKAKSSITLLQNLEVLRSHSDYRCLNDSKWYLLIFTLLYSAIEVQLKTFERHLNWWKPYFLTACHSSPGSICSVSFTSIPTKDWIQEVKSIQSGSFNLRPAAGRSDRSPYALSARWMTTPPS